MENLEKRMNELNHIGVKNSDLETTYLGDLDFMESTENCSNRFKDENPKMMKYTEIFEKRIWVTLKKYFIENNLELTKREIRSWITGYKSECRKPVVPLYYVWTDEEYNDFLRENGG